MFAGIVRGNRNEMCEPSGADGLRLLSKVRVRLLQGLLQMHGPKNLLCLPQCLYNLEVLREGRQIGLSGRKLVSLIRHTVSISLSLLYNLVLGRQGN